MFAFVNFNFLIETFCQIWSYDFYGLSQ